MLKSESDGFDPHVCVGPNSSENTVCMPCERHNPSSSVFVRAGTMRTFSVGNLRNIPSLQKLQLEKFWFEFMHLSVLSWRSCGRADFEVKHWYFDVCIAIWPGSGTHVTACCHSIFNFPHRRIFNCGVHFSFISREASGCPRSEVRGF